MGKAPRARRNHFADDPRWHYDDPIVRFDSFLPETNIRTNMNTNKISATLSVEDQATALDNILANDTSSFVAGLMSVTKRCVQ